MGRTKGSKNKLPGFTEQLPDPKIIDGILQAADALVSEYKPPAATLLDEWIEDSIPCRYVRFSKIAVSPAKGKEPVWEFKLDPKTKYSVDAMLYHQVGGLIFTAYGQKCVVAPANIGYWWPL